MADITTENPLKQQLSVVIITFNEEENIEKCLKAAWQVADEIIVLDSFSNDKTVEIATQFNATVHQRKWEGYAESKNFLNTLTSNPFLLSLDADEVLSEDLIHEINTQKALGFTGVYTINRLTNYCGTWIKHGGWFPDLKPRLFNKNECSWEGKFVHETLDVPKHLARNEFKSVCYHFTYKDELDHKTRAAKYATLTAQKLYDTNKKVGILKPYLSGLMRFLGMYVFRLGFLDGKAGFKIARISGWCNWLKYKELRELYNVTKPKV
jgi:glycosyltransferase involved in cell wall biosynthesis